jgi:hypothetical protein
MGHILSCLCDQAPLLEVTTKESKADKNKYLADARAGRYRLTPMATITNKTPRPLAVSLPGGKKLRLGPFNSGEIASKAVDHPAVQKLIEAGEVEILDSQHKSKNAGGGGKSGPASSGGQGQGQGGGIRKTGDR